MLILDIWDISFDAVAVFGLGKDLLFKSVLGHCDYTFEGVRLDSTYTPAKTHFTA